MAVFFEALHRRCGPGSSTYTTGTNNRLLSDGTYRYLYDAEGNRTYRFIDNNQNGQLDQGDTDITKYNWDHRNRLYKVQHQASYGAAVDWVIRYSYDYQNRLVWRRMDGNGDGDYEQKRVFVYDGNQMVMDFQRTGAGNIQASNLRWRYLWGPAVDQILAEEAVNGGADETVQWTLTDHLNTVRDIAKYNSQTDTTTVVNHLVYDAFGKLTSETNPAVDSLFLFTARPFDPDAQLQNNLNRWYDASVGRWLSEDPIGFAGGDGNLYRYVGNEPTTFCDHMGEDRRIVGWLVGHLVIEVRDPTTGESVFLDFGPGYGGPQFRDNPDYLPGCIPMSDWIPSTPQQDQQLIDLWKTLEEDRKRGAVQPWMNLPGIPNPLWNCWTPVIMFLDYPGLYPPNRFPPGWNPREHACWNCHAPQVKAWLRASLRQRENWQWPPASPKP